MTDNIINHKNLLSARAAVYLMAQCGMVLRDFNSYDEDDIILIWWSDGCHCFHWWVNGEFKGIYTQGTFANMRAWFVFPFDYEEEVSFKLHCLLHNRHGIGDKEYRESFMYKPLYSRHNNSRYIDSNIIHVGNHLLHRSEWRQK
jgi:hypothetical protein